jgi:hypothetical protein
MFVVNGKPELWSIEKIDGTGFVIKNTRAENVSMTVNDINYADNLKDISADERGLVNEDIYPCNLTIKYDNKTLVPEAYGIGERKGNKAFLAAVSIDVPEGYRITSIFNTNGRIYAKDFDPKDHLYFIGNFAMTKNDKKNGIPCVNITAIDYSNRKVIAYSVRYDNTSNRVKVASKRFNFENIPKKGERGHIRTEDYISKSLEAGIEVFPIYYPSSPTNAILMVGEDSSELKEVIKEKKNRWRRFQDYEIITGINEEVLHKMHDEDGYDAVTVYLADGPVSLQDLKDSIWASRLGEDIANLILNIFSTIYLIGNDGSLIKVKLHGTITR